MIVRGLDGAGDWLFGKGKNDYKKNQAAIAQMINTRLKCFLGDCFFDISGGIDWFNLNGSKQQIQLQLAISSVILNTEGVQKIVSVSSTLGENRTMTVIYKVNTIYGEVSESSTLPLSV